MKIMLIWLVHQLRKERKKPYHHPEKREYTKRQFHSLEKALKVNQYFKVLQLYSSWLLMETINPNYFKKIVLQNMQKIIINVCKHVTKPNLKCLNRRSLSEGLT